MEPGASSFKVLGLQAHMAMLGFFIWGLGIKTFVEQAFLLTVTFLHCTFF